MRTHPVLSIILVLILLSGAFLAAFPQGRGHKLYGDLRIDEKALAGLQPMAFMVSLVTLSGGGNYGPGSVIARQQVTPNGRYQFLGVPNGEYELVIEREGVEVGRMRFIIQEQRFTDIRRDVTLQWRPDAPGAPAKPGTAAAANLYQRKSTNVERFEMALQAGGKKDYGKAIDLLRQVVASDEKDFEAWSELGTMQFMKGDHSEAEKCYQRSLQVNSGYLLAMLNLGKLQLAGKKYDAAVETLTKAAEQEPKSPDVNYYLGEAYLGIKKGSKAVGYLNEAIRLDPLGKAEAHLRLAALYSGAGMKDRAAAEYEQFLTKKPDYPDRQKLEQYIRDNRKP